MGGPCSFLEAAARSSERAQRQRRLVASAQWRTPTGSARCPAPLPLLERGQRADLKFRAACLRCLSNPTEKNTGKGTARAYARCQFAMVGARG